MYLRNVTTKSTRSYSEDIKILKDKIENADAIVVGAGAGLSTSAGFIYDGETFKKYMFDFINKYGITDFYTGENFIKVIIISNIMLSFQKKVYKFYFILLYHIKWY